MNTSPFAESLANANPDARALRQLWPISLRDLLPAARLEEVLRESRPGLYDFGDGHNLSFAPPIGHGGQDPVFSRFRDSKETAFVYRDPLAIQSRFLARIQNATLIWDSYLAIKNRFLITDSYHSEELLNYVISQELPKVDLQLRFDNVDEQFRLFFHRFGEPVTISEPCIVITSRCAGNYWHWMTEVLPRLWAYLECGGAREFRLVLPHLTTQFQHDSLRLFGVDPVSAIQYSNPVEVRIRDGLYPSMISPGGYSAVIAEFYRRFCRLGLPAGGRRRLYISRQIARSRRLLNEAEIFDRVLRPLGFEMVVTERFSFEAQARLFAEAEAVIGVHGAGLTNILFSRPGITCVELLSDRIFGKYYWMLSSAMGHRYGCYFGQSAADPALRANGDFLISPEGLRGYLESSGVSLGRSADGIAPPAIPR